MLGRSKHLLREDLGRHGAALSETVEHSRFLIIGAAGSIGQAVTLEIFSRNPRVLHAVDINENNLVELVRDIRSSHGYIKGDFRTFALDAGSPEFEAFFRAEGPYDYILNLSALKHVRSEKDPYTLMRMIQVNILNTLSTLKLGADSGARKYFCVSTDKAANPVNMMGASKRIMEMYLLSSSEAMPISTARFANVAFSDGSLLHGFNMRLAKGQPISAPNDVRRYFLTPEEAGQLCLMSALLGESRDIFFPKLSAELNLVTFSSIAERYLAAKGLEPLLCDTEDEARERMASAPRQGRWPCYFFQSDTTGEKDFEEFFTDSEEVDLGRFDSIGIVKNAATADPSHLQAFLREIERLRQSGRWTKQDIVDLFFNLLPEFHHLETGKYLDGRM
ncbi:MAG: UDP-N-acetylglucosamine 4,6-dehydratase [Geothrix sp.]|uniref:UDP-N-acetylglucosamine 4,6-dehydratase n=1 Tax=Geothrix sp. TaxID=1962974 RepID=UPI0018341045|nr:UDP-N-acetylglucosamine 4,6-dehydratase [Geothrix sp.]